MRDYIPPQRLLNITTRLFAIIMVLIPFHAFLAVWLSSFIGHYTLIRLWKEFVLLTLVGFAIYILSRDGQLRKRIVQSKLFLCMAAYTCLVLLMGVIAYATHQVTAKAGAYGLLINIRPIAIFMVAWIIASKYRGFDTRWRSLVFIPAIGVILIGLLQYFVLPYDVLKHFGYGVNTIFPYQTINSNIDFIRIMSTLRGANPLGAYMVVVCSLLLVIWRRHVRSWQFGMLPLAALLVLVLTFSRAAWLGFASSVIVFFVIQLRSRRHRLIFVALVLACVSLGAAGIIALRHNHTFQNVFAHTQTNSKVKTSSNDERRSAMREGVSDVVREPLGRGPGTAGPASAYNAGEVRIAENYFVQVGQEVGWLGLGLFVATLAYLASELRRRRSDPLALGLFCALVGLIVINTFSHAWSDDTLSYLFWGLAGLALGRPLMTVQKNKSRQPRN